MEALCASMAAVINMPSNARKNNSRPSRLHRGARPPRWDMRDSFPPVAERLDVHFGATRFVRLVGDSPAVRRHRGTRLVVCRLNKDDGFPVASEGYPPNIPALLRPWCTPAHRLLVSRQVT